MDFSKLTTYLDALKTRGIPAADCIIYVNHELVYRHFTGHKDVQGTQPLTGEENYLFYSATKIFACVAALQLIEQGKMYLDDPVCQYLPAYTLLTVADGDKTRAAKASMTIRHLMSMQSGLDYDLNAKAIQNVLALRGKNATTRELVDAIAHKPLSFDPGTDYQYSLSHDVLGGVIEAVSGIRFGDYLDENIMQPLGIKNISFNMTKKRLDNLCAQYMRDPEKGVSTPCDKENKHVLTHAYQSGGAGLMGGVAEYVLLLDALACGGVGKTGARILRPETIELYRTPQLKGKAYETFHAIGRHGYTYGLGVRVMQDPAADVKNKANKGEFGWDGAAGAYAMVDPEYTLSVFHAQHVLGYRDVYFDVHPTLRSLVYEAIGL